uniref:Uncharacterized protein n=2 Tax=Aegilops tauschii subsp. strangulata TaxID=200361 RepID=A0A453P269_AEGTS
IPSHRTACVLSPLPCPSQSHTPPNLPHRRSSQSRRRCLLRPETTAAGTPTPSPAFYLPQLVLSPVDLEEPPFARHRGRAAATTRGPPPTGAPSFSTMRHQQRRTTPPSTPSHDVQPLTPPETVARIGQMCSSTGSPPKAVEGRGGPWRRCRGRIEHAHTPPSLGGHLAAGARQLRGRGGG